MRWTSSITTSRQTSTEPGCAPRIGPVRGNDAIKTCAFRTSMIMLQHLLVNLQVELDRFSDEMQCQKGLACPGSRHDVKALSLFH